MHGAARAHATDMLSDLSIRPRRAMNALIVLAHPEPLSFNAALGQAAARALQAMGHEVRWSDLYRQGFDARAHAGDFTQRTSPRRLSYAHEQRHAAAARAYAADILAEQDKLAWADLVLFQFPMWWYAPPAILKGWFDRVLSNGFAYADGRCFEDGLLRGKLGMVCTTTGGTRAELDADSRHTGTVEEVLRPVTGGVIAFTGMTALPSFVSYAPASLTAERRAGEFDRLGEHLQRALAGLSHAERLGP
jgi:NAD(P)H dehydrogenase (quinone)